jgi:hypothetical protein
VVAAAAVEEIKVSKYKKNNNNIFFYKFFINLNYIYLNYYLYLLHKISIMALKVGDLVLISIPNEKFILNNNNFLCNQLDIGQKEINVTFECLDDVFNIKSIEINIFKGYSGGIVKGTIISKKSKPIIGFTTPIQINDFEFETTNAYNIINNFNISNLYLLNYKKGRPILLPDKENGYYKKIKLHILKYENHGLVKSCGLHSEISQGCGGGGGASLATNSKNEIPQIKWECDKCGQSSKEDFLTFDLIDEKNDLLCSDCYQKTLGEREDQFSLQCF